MKIMLLLKKNLCFIVIIIPPRSLKVFDKAIDVTAVSGNTMVQDASWNVKSLYK